MIGFQFKSPYCKYGVAVLYTQCITGYILVITAYVQAMKLIALDRVDDYFELVL